MSKFKKIFVASFLMFTCLIAGVTFMACGKKIPATNMYIEGKSYEETPLKQFNLVKGRRRTLRVVVEPSNASDFLLKGTSSNNEIAYCNPNNPREVRAIENGSAVITYTIEGKYTEDGKDLTTSCIVYVNQGNLTKIHVEVEQSYYQGSEFPLNTLKVYKIFENPLEKIPENLIPTSELDIKLDGVDIKTQNILKEDSVLTVSYTDPISNKVFTQETPLNVVPDMIEEITITFLPFKMEYFVGERFDPTGMQVTAKTENRPDHIITNYKYKTTPLSYNDQSITIYYEDDFINPSTNHLLAKKIPITIKAKHTVNNINKLQSVIDNAQKGDSIFLAISKIENISQSILIPKSKNLTIYGQNSSFDEDKVKINVSNNVPVFKIVNDVEDSNQYFLTLANIIFTHTNENTTPFILSETKLTNIDINIENSKINYYDNAIKFVNANNININLKKVLFSTINNVSLPATPHCMHFENVINSSLNITNVLNLTKDKVVVLNCEGTIFPW